MADQPLPDLKTCTKCCERKPPEEFSRDKSRGDGRFPWCKSCKRASSKAQYQADPEAHRQRSAKSRAERPQVMREWREKNRSKIRAYNVRYYADDRDAQMARVARYHEENQARLREYRKQNRERSRENDRRRRATPKGAVDSRMSWAIYNAIKGKKAGREWEALVGYTLADLMVHLERLFLPGMTWENIGQWHIDHVIPKSAFNYSDPAHIDFRRCWAMDNLQPLWALDNLRKSAKLARPFQPSLAL